MGGSQVFLEEGEQQTVETLIKCIVIASGNDASVAMAEYIAGSEGDFVERMNERAAGLQMAGTRFEDCCGLTDSAGHYTTARDVAIMSRELIRRYPKILQYSSIWMEDITHVTRQGSKPFTLSNTNKLIRGYEGCLGLKTGSTDAAKYCVSAVAERNGMTLIAVVMGAPDHKVRFQDASAMLDYGFGSCQLYVDTNTYGELEALKRKYEEALAVDDVVGLVIGTRPDCMPNALLDYLEALARRTFVLVEYGIESTLDCTLRRINRGHTWQAAVDAVERTAARGLPVGGHVILGLPGESREDILGQAADISRLPLDTLKLHQLQLIRGTRMAREYEERPEDFHLFHDVDEYISLVVDYIQRLRPDLVLERSCPSRPKNCSSHPTGD